MLHSSLSALNRFHLKLNPVAKVFIISESFFWSGWNILLPLISVFMLQNLSSITIQSVSYAYSSYLFMRVIGSLSCGVFLNKLRPIQKNWLIIIGICIINLSYLGFITIVSIPAMYFFYGLTGLLTGLISPIRAALFSTHLAKNQETTEFSLVDAIVLTSISIAAALSGILVTHLGYQSVFIFSAVLNTFSIIPYLYLLRYNPSNL